MERDFSWGLDKLNSAIDWLVGEALFVDDDQERALIYQRLGDLKDIADELGGWLKEPRNT